mmetsp:Transcript_38755/g.90082  ORF Transcript_38755/g.90082 Transcript_38755/m.90082 type:complete len:131 (+) Transcript_38755:363-755(+)
MKYGCAAITTERLSLRSQCVDPIPASLLQPERENGQKLHVPPQSCSVAGDRANLASQVVDHRSKKDTGAVEKIMANPQQCRRGRVVLGERKMGGNAQSITGTSWIHHTRFLWDFDYESMEYLTLPQKRPI